MKQITKVLMGILSAGALSACGGDVGPSETTTLRQSSGDIAATAPDLGGQELPCGPYGGPQTVVSCASVDPVSVEGIPGTLMPVYRVNFRAMQAIEGFENFETINVEMIRGFLHEEAGADSEGVWKKTEEHVSTSVQPIFGTTQVYIPGFNIQVDAGISSNGLRSAYLNDGSGNLHALQCWDVAFGWDIPDFKSYEFNYQGHNGKCVNSDGEEGLNDLPIAFVRETGRGACTDFNGVDLNEEDYSGPKLSGWDLRGASLQGAKLAFADLEFADLAGADLRQDFSPSAPGFAFGYARVKGTVDKFTQGVTAAEIEAGEISWMQ